MFGSICELEFLVKLIIYKKHLASKWSPTSGCPQSSRPINGQPDPCGVVLGHFDAVWEDQGKTIYQTRCAFSRAISKSTQSDPTVPRVHSSPWQPCSSHRIPLRCNFWAGGPKCPHLLSSLWRTIRTEGILVDSHYLSYFLLDYINLYQANSEIIIYCNHCSNDSMGMALACIPSTCSLSVDYARYCRWRLLVGLAIDSLPCSYDNQKCTLSGGRWLGCWPWDCGWKGPPWPMQPHSLISAWCWGAQIISFQPSGSHGGSWWWFCTSSPSCWGSSWPWL